MILYKYQPRHGAVSGNFWSRQGLVPSTALSSTVRDRQQGPVDSFVLSARCCAVRAQRLLRSISKTSHDHTLSYSLPKFGAQPSLRRSGSSNPCTVVPNSRAKRSESPVTGRPRRLGGGRLRLSQVFGSPANRSSTRSRYQSHDDLALCYRAAV